MAESTSSAPRGAASSQLGRWRGTQSPTDRLRRWLYRHRVALAWTSLLGIALLLFGSLIASLLFAPQRTPLVALVAAPYTWPVPPLACTDEDVGKLRQLDGQSLSIQEADTGIVSRDDFFTRFDRALERPASGNVPTILWVSLQGVAPDGQDTAYLIPAEAAADDPSGWIDLREVADRLRERRSGSPVLIVLDCQRMSANWNLGLLENPFTSRAERILQPAANDNVAILLTTDQDQAAAFSADLGGSAFAHFFRQGMAGAADQRSGIGDANGWVSIDELTAFIDQELMQWSRHYRSAEQHPRLLAGDSASQLRLGRALNRTSVKRLVDTDRAAPRLRANLSSDRIDALWQQLDRLRASDLYQLEPVAWRDLEHQILWLEQLSAAGSRYQTLATRTLDALEGKLQGITTRLAKLSTPGSLPERCNVIAIDSWAIPGPLRVHSTSLASYLNTPGRDAAQRITSLTNDFYASNDPRSLEPALRSIAALSAGPFQRDQFLRMVDRYQSPVTRERPDLLRRLAAAQSRFDRLTIPLGTDDGAGDLRIVRWMQPLIESLAQVRRDCEDQWLAGSIESLDDSLVNLERQIALVSAAQIDLHQVIKITDRSMAATPYLAQWLADPRWQPPAAAAADGSAERLVTLIQQTRAIASQATSQSVRSDASDQGETDIPAAVGTLKDQADGQVSRPLEALVQELDEQARRLVRDSESNDASLVTCFDAILRVPLVPWETRRDLRAAQRRLEKRLHENDPGTLAESEPSANSGADTGVMGTALAEKRRAIAERLFQALLNRSDDERAVAAPSGSDQPGAVAERIASMEQQVAAAIQEQELTEQQVTLDAIANDYRALAPLWFKPPAQPPHHAARHVHLAQLMLVHAELSMEDYWGPAGGRRAFFDLAAEDYLAAARKLVVTDAAEASASEPAPLPAFDNRLQSLRAVGNRWMSLDVHPTVQLAEGEPVRSMVDVAMTSPDPLPQRLRGTAALQVEDRSPVPTTPKATFPSTTVPVPIAGATVGLRIDPPVLIPSRNLAARLHFRGHEITKPMEIDPLDGIRIDVQPARYEASEVTLTSPWDALSVVFVLDCSDSMGDAASGPVDGEAVSRLDVARGALQELLFRLGSRENVRVGVTFFGHRLGWSTDTPVRRLIRPDFRGALPANVTPSQDVESVLPLGPFGLEQIKQVIPRVTGVQPWGQSPLYLSVVESLEQFRDDPADADRHVIVITDGANYQFIPAEARNVSATRENDVLEQWSQNQVPVHILGLGMTRQEDREAIDEFSRICTTTGGEFQSLTGQTDLTQALGAILDAGTYRLSSSGSPSVLSGQPERRTSIGRPIRLNPPPKTPERFELVYEGRRWQSDPEAGGAPDLASEPVWLEGGESIRLVINPAGTEIFAYPFDLNVVESRPLSGNNGMKTDYVVRVHRPRHEKPGDVVFPISWQRRAATADATSEDWKPTRRPDALWIRIQPLAPTGNPIGQAFVFYDAVYQADQPVPVLNATARDWPTTATRADISIQCTPPATPGFELLPPTNNDSGGESDPPLARSLTLADVIDGEVEMEHAIRVRAEIIDSGDQRRRLRCVLDFSSSDLPVDGVKVSIDDEHVSQILRQFDATHQLAVHTFTFSTDQESWPERIRILDARATLKEAWQLRGGSIEIDVPASGSLLPITRESSEPPSPASR